MRKITCVHCSCKAVDYFINSSWQHPRWKFPLTVPSSSSKARHLRRPMLPILLPLPLHLLPELIPIPRRPPNRRRILKPLRARPTLEIILIQLDAIALAAPPPPFSHVVFPVVLHLTPVPAVFPHAAPDAQSDDDESHEPDGEPDLEPRSHGNGVLDSYFWQVGRVDG